MTQRTVVEDQVIEVLQKGQACDIEDVTRQCANLTWNQVFLAVDRLSRKGEVMLTPTGLGTYAVAVPQRQEGRSDREALPS